jgi:inorganic pyrophosphatase
MRVPHLIAIAVLPCTMATAQDQSPAPRVLPAVATTRLASSLDAAAAHRQHTWRDTAPLNADGTVNAYIEIARGDRRKWEFDMRANALAIDRVIPEDVGGYPVNYGFVPGTISYDGDPFDALVLGRPLKGGTIVRGVIVGLMYMEDEKGLDSKVVLSAAGPDGSPIHRLDAGAQEPIAKYFGRYKRHEPGGFSRVPGWGSAAEGRGLVETAHAFFLECRRRAGRPCDLAR